VSGTKLVSLNFFLGMAPLEEWSWSSCGVPSSSTSSTERATAWSAMGLVVALAQSAACEASSTAAAAVVDVAVASEVDSVASGERDIERAAGEVLGCPDGLTSLKRVPKRL
jgi:hypothetical protein